ncbi:MAG: hypothetical protein CMD55_03805 [Gammaproteobacteria bacterium]|jgi:hypothetical protein|nr:hypothetical protein [Gammaproteobacteria bacterium]|tara:strand:- start:6889 stop:7254 length:366 start_codon:yes stop_codon:yes gene_type:complete
MKINEIITTEAPTWSVKGNPHSRDININDLNLSVPHAPIHTDKKTKKLPPGADLTNPSIDIDSGSEFDSNWDTILDLDKKFKKFGKFNIGKNISGKIDLNKDDILKGKFDPTATVQYRKNW